MAGLKAVQAATKQSKKQIKKRENAATTEVDVAVRFVSPVWESTEAAGAAASASQVRILYQRI